MTSPIPPRYRRLLATYPRAWRREHEAVVLGTLLEADEAAGRSHPTRRDRFALLTDGIGVRLGRRHRRTPLPSGAVLHLPTDFHMFNQANGAPLERELSEAEQITQNTHGGSATSEAGNVSPRITGVSLGVGGPGGI